MGPTKVPPVGDRVPAQFELVVKVETEHSTLPDDHFGVYILGNIGSGEEHDLVLRRFVL